MSDEQAPKVETPAADDQSAVVDGQPIVNWEKRYNDLRPEFDRTSQEASQYRQAVEQLNDPDPYTRQQAAAALGIELVDTEDTEDSDAFEDPTTRRLSALEQQLADREARDQASMQEANERAQVNQAAQAVGQQLDSLNVDDEQTRNLIVGMSLTLPRTPEGLPDIEAAHAQVVAYENSRKKTWANSKKGAYVSPVGTSGTQAPDLDNQEQRIAWMTSRLAAMDD